MVHDSNDDVPPIARFGRIIVLKRMKVFQVLVHKISGFSELLFHERPSHKRCGFVISPCLLC